MSALRLPDQFTPGALSATAATPTCCCCCCCCLASTLTTPIVLHGGLGRDLARVAERPERHKKARAYSVLVWFAALLATLLIAMNLTVSGEAFLVLVTAIVLMSAAAVASIASWAGSTRPVVPAARLVVGAFAFAGELIAGAFLVIQGFGYLLIGLVIVVISVAVAMKVYRS
ncbi:hypothetical protein SAMN05192558_102573 [Actinokineospora alba]|uniref:Uncharacterized protein n=1 Tax=Actinokineospora alba TaxID=504798 RepID=A0A1H0II91_9PSEU|nr:hypothetical protein [Actinokineospora alba]TDP70929.1 hypothetical protein C8E96_6561 [Actinokineospora alba]SDI89794.1 hypothetical protein SAMN05421871_108272 [Actinokineospora alba]SDO31189.1 hypothetical protein SAMN05192558_102573 [Actinokineospora alba]